MHNPGKQRSLEIMHTGYRLPLEQMLEPWMFYLNKKTKQTNNRETFTDAWCTQTGHLLVQPTGCRAGTVFHGLLSSFQRELYFFPLL